MRNKLRKVSLLLLVMLLALTAIYANGTKEEGKEFAAEQAASQERVYVDGLGRENTLPYPLERIAPSGNLAQMMLYALCPEKMVGLAKPLSDNAMGFMLDEIKELPAFGTFYGKRANFNKEAVIMAHPEAVIDVGEIKKNMNEDLDALQKQLGIPVVFVEGYLENTGDTLRELGRLVGKEEYGNVLGEYADKVIDYAKDAREKIETPLRAYYSASPDPLNGYPKGSFHGEILDFVGFENVLPATFSSGGNQITMEQMMIWNPEVMFIQDEDAYNTIITDAKWAGIDAVMNKRVYRIPVLPYPFLSGPPAINRLIGIYWLGTTCYPELYEDINLEEEMKTFYDLFYHYTLADEEIERILFR